MKSPTSNWFLASLVGFGFGCGGNSNPAPVVDMAPEPDVEPDVPFFEGGGTTLEYQAIFDPTAANNMRVQARVTSYYWKQLTPVGYPFPMNPGCTKTGLQTIDDDSDDVYPWGMGRHLPNGGADHTYQDVGTIQISGGASPIDVPLGPNPGFDGEHRRQDGVWHTLTDPAGGTTFLDKNDAPYSLAFGGSADWPAQTYGDGFYMPPAFTLNGFGPSQLTPDTDFVLTWAPPTPQNLPPDAADLAFVAEFSVTGLAPMLVCMQQSSVGQLTVPKALVNYVLSFSTTGLLNSALLGLRTQEFTDGTHHTHKRMDFAAKYSYVTPWSAQ